MIEKIANLTYLNYVQVPSVNGKRITTRFLLPPVLRIRSGTLAFPRSTSSDLHAQPAVPPSSNLRETHLLESEDKI